MDFFTPILVPHGQITLYQLGMLTCLVLMIADRATGPLKDEEYTSLEMLEHGAWVLIWPIWFCIQLVGRYVLEKDCRGIY